MDSDGSTLAMHKRRCTPKSPIFSDDTSSSIKTITIETMYAFHYSMIGFSFQPQDQLLGYVTPTYPLR